MSVALLRAAALAAGLAFAPLAVAQSLAPAGTGQIRALLIGINQYDNQPTLKGAVADAEDLQQALIKNGVRDVRLLRDREANRTAIVAQMDRLIATSGAGDLVIVSFAGHGTRLPEYFPGSNPSDDPLDEVFILSGFNETGPGTRERVLDKEINTWLKRLEAKGANVLFVADTCHGGGLTRSLDPRVAELSYRQAKNTAGLKDDQLRPIATANDARTTDDDFKLVTFIAAVDPFTKAPEVKVPGEPVLRGAVSFAVARALEGRADRNGDGVTTRRELIGYARQQANQLSEGQQTPVASPRRADQLEAPLFRKATVTATTPTEPRAIAVEPGAVTLKLAVLNGTAATLGGVTPFETKFTLVDKAASPDLVWDARTQEAISPLGDVVAQRVLPRDLPHVVDRMAAVAAIQALSQSRSQPISLVPNSKLHKKGERVAFEIGEVLGRHVILINIAGDGTVQFLAPGPEAGPVTSAAYTQKLDVVEPFGADFAVTIVSDRRLPDLERALARLNNVKAAGKVPAIIADHLKATKAGVGHASLFTAP